MIAEAPLLVPEVADFLHVSEDTVDALVTAGKLTAVDGPNGREIVGESLVRASKLLIRSAVRSGKFVCFTETECETVLGWGVGTLNRRRRRGDPVPPSFKIGKGNKLRRFPSHWLEEWIEEHRESMTLR